MTGTRSSPVSPARSSWRIACWARAVTRWSRCGPTIAAFTKVVITSSWTMLSSRRRSSTRASSTAARARCCWIAPAVALSWRIESVSNEIPMITALGLITSTSMSCIAATTEMACPDGVSRTPANSAPVTIA